MQRMNKIISRAFAILPFALAASVISGSSNAQDLPVIPPSNAVALSTIVAEVEKRQDFKYIEEIEWDDKGYIVTYYTSDKAKVEIKYDPVSGKPQ